jgi:hypothetical protein
MMIMQSNDHDLNKVQQYYLTVSKLLLFFARRMAARNAGHIVVVGSYKGVTVGLPGFSFLSSCHNALWALCESIRAELKAHNVFVSYYAALQHMPDPDGRVYVVKKIGELFPTLPASVQAETLMEGVAHQ